MDLKDIITLVIASLSFILAVVSLIITLVSSRRQTQMAFFAEYTKRYQEIMFHILLDDGNKKQYERLYLDLCSEEYYLHKKNYLPQKVWKMWEDGMKLMAKHQSLETTWRDSRCLYNKQFIQFFEDIIKDSKSNKYNTL
jgi:hypothetical protein